MKRKALLQNQLETLENNMMRIIEQQQLLENSQATVQTVAALQQSAQAQKANMSEFKIEKVDKVMEEIQEAAEQATEIQQALAMPLGPAAEFDEDALESELAELEEQEAASKLDAELLAPARVPTAVPGGEMRLPDVPTTVPAIPSKAQKTTEDELEDLMKELTA